MSAKLFDLTGRVAIITGASRGIGQSIAETLAGAGAKVVLASRKQSDLDEVAASIRAAGGQALAISAHTGKKETLTALVERTMAEWGRIDILVNNAATNPHFGPTLEAEDSHWMKTIEVNLMGNVWLCQAIVPIMRQQGGGKIINVASVVGLRPGHFQGVYSVTKAALLSLTQSLAMELGVDNIRVNAIAPGLIQTKFAQVIWENESVMQNILGRTPLGRIGQPQDIANLALWLASPASDFATGATFVVDGGVTLGSI
ncbi:MAG: glucose 1-dehydrogenase [Anaerolineae bacterium]|nr:glucose 1-dehydrogenase [Anaerolineae bacterium]MDW8173598.1 glucose 1-dehydrogenase [Anaerolineae bacterium]